MVIIEDLDRFEDPSIAYMGGTSLDRIDSAHLGMPFDAMCDPDHYRITIEGTTLRLVDALAGSLGDAITTNCPVTAVVRDGDADRYRVSTQTGETFMASSVVVAVPLNTLSRIELPASVPQAIVALAATGHVGRSRKTWMLLENVHDHFRVFAADPPFAYFRSEHDFGDGRMLAVALGPDTGHPLGAEELSAAVRKYLPEASVASSYEKDSLEDAHYRGTWFVPGPVQMASLATAPLADDRLYFAGGDLAIECFGTIEGALLTGRRAGAAAAAGQRSGGH
nr:FAD-dependent oxidoreductase [Herbiconiux solani]